MPAQKPEAALREMGSDLNLFLRYLRDQHILDDVGSSFGISDALGNFKKTKHELEWSYKSGKVVVRLAHSAVAWPENASSLVCSLTLEVNGKVRTAHDKGASNFDWEIVRTQMEIEFSAESTSLGSGWSQHWHLDTHIDLPGKPVPDEAHPRFHLHYGGRAMAARRMLEPTCWGRALELTGPRFVHPPLDLVLALDFILANATGSRWKGEFWKAKEYTAAVCNSQRRFWRPHQYTLSDYYECGRLKEAGHPARLLVPTLLVSEL